MNDSTDSENTSIVESDTKTEPNDISKDTKDPHFIGLLEKQSVSDLDKIDKTSTELTAAASSNISAAFNMNASTTSSSSTDSTISCRICKAHGGQDLVLSPCNCKGSMGVVHVTCLEQWLTGSIRDTCELCSMPFNVIRTHKYTCLKSIHIYLQQQVSLPRLIRDLFFLSVSLMNTTILLYMWLAYVFRDVFALFNENVAGKSILPTALKGIVYLFFFTLCLMFIMLNAIDDFRRITHYYILPWYRWWQSTVDVKLITIQQNTTDKPKQE